MNLCRCLQSVIQSECALATFHVQLNNGKDLEFSEYTLYSRVDNQPQNLVSQLYAVVGLQYML